MKSKKSYVADSRNFDLFRLTQVPGHAAFFAVEDHVDGAAVAEIEGHGLIRVNGVHLGRAQRNFFGLRPLI